MRLVGRERCACDWAEPPISYATTGEPVSGPRPRRRTPRRQTLDNATYGCSCGLIFEAAVSTGVRCPACGNHQAW
jgi:hypothetical protein